MLHTNALIGSRFVMLDRKVISDGKKTNLDGFVPCTARSSKQQVVVIDDRAMSRMRDLIHTHTHTHSRRWNILVPRRSSVSWNDRNNRTSTPLSSASRAKVSLGRAARRRRAAEAREPGELKVHGHWAVGSAAAAAAAAAARRRRLQDAGSRSRRINNNWGLQRLVRAQPICRRYPLLFTDDVMVLHARRTAGQFGAWQAAWLGWTSA